MGKGCTALKSKNKYMASDLSFIEAKAEYDNNHSTPRYGWLGYNNRMDL